MLFIRAVLNGRDLSVFVAYSRKSCLYVFLKMYLTLISKIRDVCVCLVTLTTPVLSRHTHLPQQ